VPDRDAPLDQRIISDLTTYEPDVEDSGTALD